MSDGKSVIPPSGPSAALTVAGASTSCDETSTASNSWERHLSFLWQRAVVAKDPEHMSVSITDASHFPQARAWLLTRDEHLFERCFRRGRYRKHHAGHDEDQELAQQQSNYRARRVQKIPHENARNLRCGHCLHHTQALPVFLQGLLGGVLARIR